DFTFQMVTRRRKTNEIRIIPRGPHYGVRRGVNNSLIRTGDFRNPPGTQSRQPAAKDPESFRCTGQPASGIVPIPANSNAAASCGSASETAGAEVGDAGK